VAITTPLDVLKRPRMQAAKIAIAIHHAPRLGLERPSYNTRETMIWPTANKKVTPEQIRSNS
jgi:hypothetical protein